MRSSLAFALLAAVLAGCSSSEPNPPSFAVSPSQQWSGGTITVRSSLFDERVGLPVVTAAGVPMTVVRVDDTTLTATLPVLPTQSAPIRVIRGSSHYDLGTVDVFGYRTQHQATPGFLYESVATTIGGAPTIVAGLYPPQPPAGALAILDLRTATSQIATGVQPPGPYGVGASYLPGHLILTDSTGTVGEWQVDPVLAHVDTVPLVNFTHQVARLGNQVWLFTGSHSSTVRRAGAPDILVQQEDPYGYHFSAAADRALQNSFATIAGGTPVFQMSTGDTLYRFMLGVHAAVFSASGLTLYIAGFAYAVGGGDELWSVDAATGTPLHKVSLPFDGAQDPRLVGMALSADQTRLFIGASQDTVPEVEVYDAATLTLLGRLTATASSGCHCMTALPQGGNFVVDEASGTMFLVVNGEPAPIWEFDMLP